MSITPSRQKGPKFQKGLFSHLSTSPLLAKQISQDQKDKSSDTYRSPCFHEDRKQSVYSSRSYNLLPSQDELITFANSRVSEDRKSLSRNASARDIQKSSGKKKYNQVRGVANKENIQRVNQKPQQLQSNDTRTLQSTICNMASVKNQDQPTLNIVSSQSFQENQILKQKLHTLETRLNQEQAHNQQEKTQFLTQLNQIKENYVKYASFYGKYLEQSKTVEELRNQVEYKKEEQIIGKNTGRALGNLVMEVLERVLLMKESAKVNEGVVGVNEVSALQSLLVSRLKELNLSDDYILPEVIEVPQTPIKGIIQAEQTSAFGAYESKHQTASKKSCRSSTPKSQIRYQHTDENPVTEGTIGILRQSINDYGQQRSRVGPFQCPQSQSMDQRSQQLVGIYEYTLKSQDGVSDQVSNQQSYNRQHPIQKQDPHNDTFSPRIIQDNLKQQPDLKCTVEFDIDTNFNTDSLADTQGSQVIEIGVAKADFNGTKAQDLKFKIGEKIFVESRMKGSDWAFGSVGLRKGWFPIQHVELQEHYI